MAPRRKTKGGEEAIYANLAEIEDADQIKRFIDKAMERLEEIARKANGTNESNKYNVNIKEQPLVDMSEPMSIPKIAPSSAQAAKQPDLIDMSGGKKRSTRRKTRRGGDNEALDKMLAKYQNKVIDPNALMAPPPPPPPPVKEYVQKMNDPFFGDKAFGGKKKRVTRRGGSAPSMGAPIMNTSGLLGNADPYTQATAASFANSPDSPFSAGMPMFGSSESGLPTSMTNSLSGGLLQSGGRRTRRTRR